MSGSNPISREAVSVAVAEANQAIEAATNLAELRASRANSIGEHSPIAKLNAELKNIANEFKAEAGQLIGQARGQLNQAFAAKEAELFAVEERAKLAA
ncbi:MAG: phenylalanine--tRNA ligase subunit alpha, partial [Phenylobacterium zucineum]